MDLVVGATGFVGQQIALGLRNEGRTVRAVARGGKSHEKAGPLLSAGIEVADADLTRPATLALACAGVDTIVCTATSMPHGREDGLQRVDREGVLALIGSAEQAGVRHFVYTSYSGNIRVPSPLETAKRDCENRLLAGTMHATILRPSYFMEVWLSPMLGFDAPNVRARMYGTGENKVSYISATDVVAYATAAVKKPPERSAILEMGGPEALSQLDAVRIFERAVGKQFELERIPLDVLEEQHRSTDPLQKTFAALMIGYAKGDAIPGSAETAKSYGITLHSVSEYATSMPKIAAV